MFFFLVDLFINRCKVTKTIRYSKRATTPIVMNKAGNAVSEMITVLNARSKIRVVNSMAQRERSATININKVVSTNSCMVRLEGEAPVTLRRFNSRDRERVVLIEILT